ncbi:MAG TPA: hypothetical protein GXX48_01930 [Ochrobactrum intermedium]|uniref:Uncharacterized protein n=1 Tax=Brucella intermedia TaxID=94625 RepID=A0A7V6P8L1_9HYPH|nr:hypothetical protein [Brucella intermedia]HHV66399.1 hypothetical protein [Brucella intermedia]
MTEQSKPDAQSSEMSDEEREKLRKAYREAVRNCWKDGSAAQPKKGRKQ